MKVDNTGVINTKEWFERTVAFKVSDDGKKIKSEDYEKYHNALNTKVKIPSEIKIASDGRMVHESQLQEYEAALKIIEMTPIETAFAKDGTEVIASELKYYEALCTLTGREKFYDDLNKDIEASSIIEEIITPEELSEDIVETITPEESSKDYEETIKEFVNDNEDIIKNNMASKPQSDNPVMESFDDNSNEKSNGDEVTISDLTPNIENFDEEKNYEINKDYSIEDQPIIIENEQTETVNIEDNESLEKLLHQSQHDIKTLDEIDVDFIKEINEFNSQVNNAKEESENIVSIPEDIIETFDEEEPENNILPSEREINQYNDEHNDISSRHYPGSDISSRHYPGSDISSRHYPGSDISSRHYPGSDISSRYNDDSLDVHYEEREINGRTVKEPSITNYNKVLNNAEFDMLERAKQDKKVLFENNFDIQTINDMSYIDLALTADEINAQGEHSKRK